MIVKITKVMWEAVGQKAFAPYGVDDGPLDLPPELQRVSRRVVE